MLHVAVDGRTGRHRRRDDGDKEADDGHRQRRTSAAHESLILGQVAQEAGVGHPALLARTLAGSTCEHPPDDGRHHDDQQDDGNKPPKPHTFTASTAMVSTRVTASCEGCPCGMLSPVKLGTSHA